MVVNSAPFSRAPTSLVTSIPFTQCLPPPGFPSFPQQRSLASSDHLVDPRLCTPSRVLSSDLVQVCLSPANFTHGRSPSDAVTSGQLPPANVTPARLPPISLTPAASSLMKALQMHPDGSTSKVLIKVLPTPSRGSLVPAVVHSSSALAVFLAYSSLPP